MVLVIDDNDDIRECLAELLEDEGYEVTTSENGEQAREILQQKRPCLVIMDLMMPVLDGWALRAWMLAQPDLADIPVLLLSARPDVDEEAHRLRAVAGLTKPMSIERLFEHVAEHC